MRYLISTILIVLLILISPLLALWGLNTISQQGGLGWYIPHNLWTYLAVYAITVTFGRTSTN